MEFTPKQERNGATGGTAAGSTAEPGPDYTAAVKSAVRVAMSAAKDGPPITVSPGVVDWETGVSIQEMPGEA